MGKGEGVLNKDGTGSEPAPVTEATLPREITEAILGDKRSHGFLQQRTTSLKEHNVYVL